MKSDCTVLSLSFTSSLYYPSFLVLQAVVHLGYILCCFFLKVWLDKYFATLMKF